MMGAMELDQGRSTTAAIDRPEGGVPRGPVKSLRRETIVDAVKNLHPAYFAMVMATGIVAIASQLTGLRTLAVGLSWLNIGVFIVLWTLTLARVILFPRDFFRDLIDHKRGPGFFTIVAGTSVLGRQQIIVFGHYTVATAMWFLALPLWAGFTYAIFTGFTVKEDKPSLAEGIHGGWLIAVVATQAVSSLGTLLASRFPAHETEMLFFSLCMWLCGGMLYIWVISLIFYRYTFFRFLPSDLMPPYWINMGAMAISTLAGANLILNASRAPIPAGAAAVPQGLHRIFLGNRHVVDSDAGDARHLAARLQAVPVELRPAVLGRRIPAGHVHGKHLSARAGFGPAIPAVDSTLLRVHRCHRLDGHIRWAALDDEESEDR